MIWSVIRHIVAYKSLALGEPASPRMLILAQILSSFWSRIFWIFSKLSLYANGHLFDSMSSLNLIRYCQHAKTISIWIGEVGCHIERVSVSVGLYQTLGEPGKYFLGIVPRSSLKSAFKIEGSNSVAYAPNLGVSTNPSWPWNNDTVSTFIVSKTTRVLEILPKAED